MPQYGYKFNRVAVDSTLHIPSYCGVPSITDYIKNGMIAIDTCNNVLFQWTRANGWTPISTGTYLDTTSLSNRINQRVKYTDTSAMLLPYLKKIDTTAMLSRYLRKSDTASLSNRINLKLSISDTSTMLSKYLRIFDTTSMLSKYLRKSDTTAMLTGKALKSTTISTTAPLTGGGNLTTNRTISIPKATTIADGYVAATDFDRFQSTLEYIYPQEPLYRTKFSGTYNPQFIYISGRYANDTTNGFIQSGNFQRWNAKVDSVYKIGDTLYVLNGYINPFTDPGRLKKIAIGGGGTVTKAVDTIYRTIGKDSIQFSIGGKYIAIKDSSGGGGTVTKAIDSMYRIVGKDSIFFRYNDSIILKFKDSVGVSKIVAGSGISISPTNGLGQVTITSTSTGGTVISVSASSPLSVTNPTTTPAIGIDQATASQNGYLTATDWNTFNGKVSSVSASGLLTSTGGASPTISSSINTNKLIGRNPSTSGAMEEITIGTGLSLTGTTLSSTSGAVASAAFGSFFDSTTQTITSTTTAYPINITKTDTAKGFHISNNKIIADSAGVYNFQWSGQFQNTDNAEQDATVWIRKNGVNVVGSTGFISVPKTHGGGAGTPGHMIASWNYIIPMNIGDSIVWYWQSNNTSVSLKYYPQQTSPTRPSTASVIVTVTPASGAISGGGSENLQQVLNNGYTLNGNFYFKTNTSDSIVNLSGSLLTASRTYNFPDANGTIALTSDLTPPTYQIDLSSANYGMGTYGTYQIKVGTDSTIPYYISFPSASSNAGKRITLVNNDNTFFNNAIIDTSVDAPKYQGTGKTLWDIPYGMSYEFLSIDGYWVCTSPTPVYIDTFASDYDGTGITTYNIPFNGTYKLVNVNGSKKNDYYIVTFPDPKKNNGERITLINADSIYSLKIEGTWLPVSKSTLGGLVLKVAPQSTYEFVSIDSQWVCVNKSTPPTFPTVDLSAGDYKIPSAGIYKVVDASANALIFPDPLDFDGQSIIVINTDNSNDASVDAVNEPIDASGTVVSIIGLMNSYTFVSISGKWYLITVY